MPLNLSNQILAEHLVEGELEPGSPVALRIDQTLLQDATGTMACMQYEQLGVPRVEELMDQAKATYKVEERRRLYQQVAEVVQQEAMDIGIYVASSLEAMNTSIQGYQQNFLGKPVFRGVWLQGK